MLLGKTATHALAYGVTTSNPAAYGTTRNPWRTGHIPAAPAVTLMMSASVAAQLSKLRAATADQDRR